MIPNRTPDERSNMKNTKRIAKQPTQEKEVQSASVQELERRPIEADAASLAEKTESLLEDLIDLPSEQQQAIQGFLTCRTRKAVAKFAGVPERTLYRWLNKPEFADALREAKRAAHAHAVARLNQMTLSAVDTMEDLMNDPSILPNIRLRAARNILQCAAQSVALETEARLDRLRLGKEVWDQVKDSNSKSLPSLLKGPSKSGEGSE